MVSYRGRMLVVLIYAALNLGLSESIETRLPEDPNMIYTVSFDYSGHKVGLDWKNRQIVAHRTCRKVAVGSRQPCQTAAQAWLVSECGYYREMQRLDSKQKDMQRAVCKGADELAAMLQARQVAER